MTGAEPDELRIERVARQRGLSFDAGRRRADGIAEGLGLSLRVTPWEGIRAEAALARGTDLRVSLVRKREAERRRASPPHAMRAPRPTGDPEIDAWLELRGEAEVSRVLAWLSPAVRTALRELEGDPGLVVARASVAIHLGRAGTPADDAAAVARLLACARVLDDARAAVPVALELRPLLGHFEALAAELGLPLSTCPLSVEGPLGGCDVLVHAPNWGPFREDVILVDVSRPGPPGAARPLPARALRVRLARWVRRGLRALSRLGARPSRLDAVLGRVLRLGPLGLPPGFVVSSARERRVVAAIRPLPRERPDLRGAVSALVRALAPEGARERGASPYR